MSPTGYTGEVMKKKTKTKSFHYFGILIEITLDKKKIIGYTSWSMQEWETSYTYKTLKGANEAYKRIAKYKNAKDWMLWAVSISGRK